MKIAIDIYKDTGKWYTGCLVIHEENIPMWDPRFKALIRNSVPANIGGGYIVVSDAHDSDPMSFHNVLYTYQQLFGGDGRVS